MRTRKYAEYNPLCLLSPWHNGLRLFPEHALDLCKVEIYRLDDRFAMHEWRWDTGELE